jgi:hypothetical protein
MQALEFMQFCKITKMTVKGTAMGEVVHHRDITAPVQSCRVFELSRRKLCGMFIPL